VGARVPTISSDTVSASGSGLVFENTYEPGVTDAYRAAILTAETYLQQHFANSVVVKADWVFDTVDANFAAQNGFEAGTLSYAAFKTALQTHATTADDQLAIAGLPLFDPSGGAGILIPSAMARALGFDTGDVGNDIQITLGSADVWSFGDDAVGAILHELTEGMMGRVAALGHDELGAFFAPLDLFRFTATGVRDYTGGTDGTLTYFGIDAAHVNTAFQFHNALDLTGKNDGQDFGDWDATVGDAFGGGGGGAFNQVSPTDLQVLDVIGWTPRAPDAPFTAGDDFASALTDTSHPFGQLTVGTAAHGVLQGPGDQDWFKVHVEAGNYLISETGGGSLANPFLRVYDSTGLLIRQADDIIPGENLDSALVIHSSVAGDLYVDAGSHLDQGQGSYAVQVLAGAATATAGSDLLLGDIGGSTLTAGAGNDTLVGRDAPNYLRGRGRRRLDPGRRRLRRHQRQHGQRHGPWRRGQ